MILHGLFGMGRNWAGIAKALSKTHRVLTVDLRNHGASPWDDAMDYRLMAGDVAKLIEAQFNGAVAVIGHSMGGKVAMTLGCEWPNLVERLCVVDIAPATYTHAFGSHLDTMASMDTRALARRTDAESIIANAVDNRHIAQFLSRNHESILQYSIQNKMPMMKAAKKIFDKRKPKRPVGNAMLPLSREAFRKDADMGDEISDGSVRSPRPLTEAVCPETGVSAASATSRGAH